MIFTYFYRFGVLLLFGFPGTHNCQNIISDHVRLWLQGLLFIRLSLILHSLSFFSSYCSALLISLRHWVSCLLCWECSPSDIPVAPLFPFFRSLLFNEVSSDLSLKVVPFELSSPPSCFIFLHIIDLFISVVYFPPLDYKLPGAEILFVLITYGCLASRTNLDTS